MLICQTSANEHAREETTRLDSCMAGIARGDPEALGDLYDAVRAPVFAYALSVLKNAQDAEDALQDCILHIHAGIGSYRSRGKPLAWILTITRNLCLQRLRQRSQQADLPEEDWEPYLQEREGLSVEDRLTIADCMNLLSDTERQIVTLHAVAGFKHREIAGMLGLPLATVLSRYNRALKKLKSHWMKGEHNHEST